jgi:hypothetical protein
MNRVQSGRTSVTSARQSIVRTPPLGTGVAAAHSSRTAALSDGAELQIARLRLSTALPRSTNLLRTPSAFPIAG